MDVEDDPAQVGIDVGRLLGAPRLENPHHVGVHLVAALGTGDAGNARRQIGLRPQSAGMCARP